MERKEALVCTHASIRMCHLVNNPNEKLGKIDAKGTKCLVLGYYKRTKAHRLICLKLFENHKK